MEFKIHCNDDELIIEGESIDEIREIAIRETTKRGWKENDCWSERIND